MNWLGGENDYYHSESKQGDAAICIIVWTLSAILTIILIVGKLTGGLV